MSRDHLSASTLNYFAAHPLARAAERRTDLRWISGAIADSRSRFLVVHHAQSLFRSAAELVYLSPAELGALSEMLSSAVFLAEEPDGAAFFALDVTAAPEAVRAELAAAGEFRDIKPLATLLPARDASLLAYARAITYWHQGHRFCGCCGAATRVEAAGHVRVCTRAACARQHFPRTDPVVIMLITCGERALLARHPRWGPTSFAPLAGFVEPGESVEAAVVREAREEVGIELHRVVYHSSQPWPFPASIILGFNAEAASEALRLDPAEVAEARWLTRAELHRQVRAGALAFPSRVSISYRLIDDWLEQRSPAAVP